MTISDRDFGKMEKGIETLEDEQKKMRGHIESLYKQDRGQAKKIAAIEAITAKSLLGGGVTGAGTGGLIYYILERFM